MVIQPKKGKGEEKKMMPSEGEMDTILVMYEIVCAEGQESDTMANLVGRIKKEKKMKAKAKSCKTCKNRDGPSFDGPCLGCSARLDFNHWEEDLEL